MQGLRRASNYEAFAFLSNVTLTHPFARIHPGRARCWTGSTAGPRTTAPPSP